MTAKRKSDAWQDCPKCLQLTEDPMLVGACASVGIEFGKSTERMLREYLDGEHQRGHPSLAGSRPEEPTDA